MTKAWGVTGEEQFMAYPIMDQLRTSKDYINQFGKSHPFLLFFLSSDALAFACKCSICSGGE